jgi:hypothetical protein
MLCIFVCTLPTCGHINLFSIRDCLRAYRAGVARRQSVSAASNSAISSHAILVSLNVNTPRAGAHFNNLCDRTKTQRRTAPGISSVEVYRCSRPRARS